MTNWIPYFRKYKRTRCCLLKVVHLSANMLLRHTKPGNRRQGRVTNPIHEAEAVKNEQGWWRNGECAILDKGSVKRVGDPHPCRGLFFAIPPRQMLQLMQPGTWTVERSGCCDRGKYATRSLPIWRVQTERVRKSSAAINQRTKGPIERRQDKTSISR